MITYDSTTPPVRQTNDWSCSICTATWMLNSLGFPVTQDEMQQQMAHLVDPRYGLLDGSGHDLQMFLGRVTGCEVEHVDRVTWQWLQQHAGSGPIGIGSASMYHWLAVRDLYGGGGPLALMNPAIGYKHVGDTMTAREFITWAPWNAVYIKPPEGEDMARIEELETSIADLQRQLDEARSYSGALGFDVIRPIVAEMDAMRQSAGVQQLRTPAGTALRHATEEWAARLRPHVIEN